MSQGFSQGNNTALQRTLADAKGDLLVATGADAIGRLAVGSNGQVLVADSGQTAGVKWAADPVADLVTTKGDLLAATAADTLARVGVGTDGQVLTAASGETPGVKWADPAGGGGPPAMPPHIAGRYYTMHFATAELTGAFADGQMSLMPFYVPEQHTYDRIALEKTTGATSGTYTLGIYEDSAGAPGALVLDAGTVSATGTGGVEITISQQLDAGWYWLAELFKGTAGSGAYRALSSLPYMGVSGNTIGIASTGNRYLVGSIGSTALPDPCPSGSISNSVPKLMLRA